MFRTWLSPRERNSAEGIKAASARFGAAFTPALMAALYVYLSWRKVFALFGLVGLVWGALFYYWYRDRPAAGRPASEPQWDAVFWKKLLVSRSVWAVGIQWFCHYYGFYFYITWLPIYLYQVRGLDLRHGSLAAGLPLFAAGFGSLFAGWTLSALTRRTSTTARAQAAGLCGVRGRGCSAGAVHVDFEPAAGDNRDEPFELRCGVQRSDILDNRDGYRRRARRHCSRIHEHAGPLRRQRCAHRHGFASGMDGERLELSVLGVRGDLRGRGDVLVVHRSGHTA